MSELTPEHPDPSVYHGNVVDDVAMGQQYLHVSLVSPTEQVFKGDAHWITAPGSDGRFGVWPRHATMVSALGSGAVRIGLPGRESTEFLVRGAFLSVNHNEVTVLVDHVLSDDEVIDVETVEAELAEISEAMKARLDGPEFLQLVDRRDWCLAQLRFARSA